VPGLLRFWESDRVCDFQKTKLYFNISAGDQKAIQMIPNQTFLILPFHCFCFNEDEIKNLLSWA
jgi:hypothetical protein